MLQKMLKTAVFAGLLGLGACQTTGGPSATASAGLIAAGYVETSVTGGQFSSNLSLSKMYFCEPSRCGGNAAVVFANGPIANTSSISIEDKIRSGEGSNTELRKVMQSSMTKASNSMSIDSLNIIRSGSKVGIIFSGAFRQNAGPAWIYYGRATVVGNSMSMSVALSDKPAIARTAAALAERD